MQRWTTRIAVAAMVVLGCTSDADRARDALREGVRLEARSPDQARRQYETAVGLDPRLGSAHDRLARLHLRQDRPLDAIAAAQRALALGDAAYLHELIARAWQKQEQWSSAIREYREAVRREPR